MAKDFFKIKKGLNLGELSAAPVPASQGDMYTDSQTNKVMVHLDGAWHEVVSHDGTHVLTNKTINAPDNTVTNIANVNIAADAAIADTKLATISTAGKVSNSATTAASSNTANAIVARGASGEFSSGAITATDLTLSGNLTVNGTTTTVNSTTLSVADKNITVNNGGTDASSEGAGITVDRTGTDGSLIYKDASGSKFAAGPLGSEIDLVNVSSAQTLTNKTISAASNTIVTSPAVNLSATTLNAALAELQGDIDTRATSLELSTHASAFTGVHGVSGNVVGTSSTQTLTNKSLSNFTTKFVDAADGSKVIKFFSTGATSNTTTTIATTAAADITISLPTSTATLVGRDTTETLTNKTFVDMSTTFVSSSDATKKFLISSDGQPNTTTYLGASSTANRYIVLPDANTTLVGLGTSDNLSNKNLFAGSTAIVDNTVSTKIKFSTTAATLGTTTTIAAASQANATITLPTASTTLVGTNSEQTLSNKNMVAGSTYFVNATDQTKAVRFTVTGSTGTTTYITASPTLDRNIVLPDESGTVVLDTSTATLSNKKFSDAVTIAEIATPATPASGFGKIYFKSDNNLYLLDDTGAEKAVGGNSTTTAVAGENLSAGDVVYISSGAGDSGRTLGEAYKVDAAADSRINFLGFVLASVSAGATAQIQTGGVISSLSGLTAGAPVYGSVSTPGALQQTVPSSAGQWAVQVGTATSSTSVAVNSAGGATAVKIASPDNPLVYTSVTSVIADTALTNGHNVVLVNSSAAARTITLAPPTSGKIFHVKKTDNSLNAVTIAPYTYNYSLVFTITAAATSLTVSTSIASSVPSSGYIQIDNEIMSYSGFSGINFTGLVRGVNGTVATSHTAGATVKVFGGIIDGAFSQALNYQYDSLTITSDGSNYYLI